MATYPSEVWPADTAIEALDGTTDAKTGLPFIAKGTGPTSTPTYEVQYNRRVDRANGILAGWRQGMVVDEGGLKIGVYPIEFTLGGQRRYFGGVSGVSVPDNSAKVIYLDGSAMLQVADDWPANVTSYLPLATASTVNGALSLADRRPRTAFHVPSVEASLVRERQILSVHRASVGQGLSDTEIFEFQAPWAMTLEEVQIYCSSVTATASVNVKEGGVSVLPASATPVAGAVVKPTVSDSAIAAGGVITVHVTTNVTGAVENLTVTLLVKAALTTA
ncbi:MAG TPA: hypothetical protein VLM89_13070 [Phycisphaerae bacterium]|nr:hypothetical protein [Phycisphaerae bacterium]